MKNLTEKDKALIKEADEAFDWQEISELEEKAESKEAKDILKYMKISAFHQEEASIRNL